MALDKHEPVRGTKAAANAHGPDLSVARASLPAPNEKLIARFRASIMCSESCALLLTFDEVACALRIGLKDAEELIATKQLASVVIAGQELVPVRELVELIDDYTAVAKRSSH
jgi:ATP:corrinoid adenosyltransferase